MRLARAKIASMLVCAAAILASACGSQPSAPIDPALTGRWAQPGLDTYCEFVLQQRAAQVFGTFGCFNAGAPKTQGFLLTGTAQLPHVVLAWTENGVKSTFDGTLSADQQHLSGTFSAGGAIADFHRGQSD